MDETATKLIDNDHYDSENIATIRDGVCPRPRAFVCLSFSDAVMKQKATWGRKGFIWLSSYNTLEREPKVGTWRQEQKQRLLRKAAYSLTLYGLLSPLIYNTEDHLTKGGSAQNGHMNY